MLSATSMLEHHQCEIHTRRLHCSAILRVPRGRTHHPNRVISQSGCAESRLRWRPSDRADHRVRRLLRGESDRPAVSVNLRDLIRTDRVVVSLGVCPVQRAPGDDPDLGAGRGPRPLCSRVTWCAQRPRRDADDRERRAPGARRAPAPASSSTATPPRPGSHRTSTRLPSIASVRTVFADHLDAQSDRSPSDAWMTH